MLHLGTPRSDPNCAFARYMADERHLDAPLSAEGVRQAERAAGKVASWALRPTLVVCSPLTRALQTAALVFVKELAEGTARLVIRPELREFFAHMPEAKGRPLAELLACPRLQAAPVQAALHSARGERWAASWDGSWAQGEGHVAHTESATRIEDFRHWLAGCEDKRVATVSHWGTINILLSKRCTTLSHATRDPDACVFAHRAGVCWRLQTASRGRIPRVGTVCRGARRGRRVASRVGSICVSAVPCSLQLSFAPCSAKSKEELPHSERRVDRG